MRRSLTAMTPLQERRGEVAVKEETGKGIDAEDQEPVIAKKIPPPEQGHRQPSPVKNPCREPGDLNE